MYPFVVRYEQAEIVRVRIEGAGADLPAADTRYHITCYQTLKATTRRSENSNTLPSEVAVEAVVSSVRTDTERVWSSVEMHTLYKEIGGVDCNRSRLVNTLKEIMGDEIMMPSSRGVATMLISKSKATVLRLDEVDQNDFDLQVKAIAGKIASETKTLGGKSLNYSNIDRENNFTFSETLLDLLSHISPNLIKSLPAAMIGSIISSIITTNPTMLQVDLGLVAYHKPAIDNLHEYRVTSTYHEILRFKISSAESNTESSCLTGFDAKNGLIQVISDNFDAHIHNQNGLK